MMQQMHVSWVILTQHGSLVPIKVIRVRVFSREEFHSLCSTAERPVTDTGVFQQQDVHVESARSVDITIRATLHKRRTSQIAVLRIAPRIVCYTMNGIICELRLSQRKNIQ